jgi:hypothetical protein
MITIRTSIGRFAKASSRSSHASRRQIQWSQSLSTSTKAAETEGNSQSENDTKPLSLFCWGTNDKGSIPTKEVLEEGRSGTTSGAGNLLNRGGAIVDHPVEIELEDAFGAS